MLLRFVFSMQMVSSLCMVGLIWFVQLVHYPLFHRAAPATFVRFEAEHARRVTWIAAPLMVAELLTSLLSLAPALRPAAIPQAEALVGAALTGATWLSTVLLQIPAHNRLGQGFDSGTITRLVAGNWIRTTAWSARGLLIAVWLGRLAG